VVRVRYAVVGNLGSAVQGDFEGREKKRKKGRKKTNRTNFVSADNLMMHRNRLLEWVRYESLELEDRVNVPEMVR